MGKIVMPKNSALLNEIESVLQIYYEANDWLTNDIYKERLKAMIGADQYQSSYTKRHRLHLTLASQYGKILATLNQEEGLLNLAERCMKQ